MRLNPEKIRTTIRKNTATSYGLTLAIGLPFPDEIRDQIQRLQEELEILAPGRFTCYGRDHLHTTLFAPVRGRYREGPPLQRDELPADVQGFACDLGDFFTQCQPFSLDLAGVRLTEEGLVVVSENTLTQQLAARLRGHPELDLPKHSKGLHVVIGYLTQPFFSEEQQMRFTEGLASFTDISVGSTTIRKIRLVHYANRTLNRIIGQVSFTLGDPNPLTAERLLQHLGIAGVNPP